MLKGIKRLSILSTIVINSFLLTISFSATSAEQEDSKLINYQDIFNLEYAASPQVSHDGKTVIYERRSMDIMADGIRIDFWQVNVDGTDQKPVVGWLLMVRL